MQLIIYHVFRVLDDDAIHASLISFPVRAAFLWKGRDRHPTNDWPLCRNVQKQQES